MPIHPVVAGRLHHLAGITSFRQALADPEQLARFHAFGSYPDAVPPAADVTERAIAGPHGPIPVRVYHPVHSRDAPLPCLVWMHGGAFQFGDLDMPEADWVSRELSRRAQAVVVSVDYRLAIEGVTYPVPHDDVVAAVRWTRDHAAELGGDPNRISVGGASAGGTLGASATLRIRDDDGWVPAALLFAYGVAHAVIPPPSWSLTELMTEVPRVLRYFPENTKDITENYLGGPASRADGYAMPALAALAGLCPTLLLNAEYDDLRSSAEAFAGALALAGVDVRQVLVRGMLHGFLNLPSSIEPVGAALDLLAETIVRATPTLPG